MTVIENIKDRYFAKANDKLSLHTLFNHSVAFDTTNYSLFLNMYLGFPDPILLSFFYFMGYYFFTRTSLSSKLGKSARLLTLL